jgi:hypothetical protein
MDFVAGARRVKEKNMQKKGIPIRLNLKFFSEGNTPITDPLANPEPLNADKTPTDQKPTEQPKPTDYRELYKTDMAFQSFVDSVVTTSNETAIENALQKQKKINDASLSRAERLQAMTDAEKVKFLEEENKLLHGKYERDREIEALKTKTTSMMRDANIPDIFTDIFDFTSATAEDIQKRVKMLSDYEYHPKGTFKKAIEDGIIAGINEKLKQDGTSMRGISTTHDKTYSDKFAHSVGLRSKTKRIK